MHRVIDILPHGQWDPALATDHVTLDHEARHRRRFRFEGAHGTAFLLDLAEAVVLADGDGLRLDDGGLIAVRAAPEPLMEVRAADPALLMRLAWHIGNRHLSADIDTDCIRLRFDHVVAAMLRGLGGDVVETSAPFTPERGAYARGHGQAPQQVHGHGRGQDHEHDLDHQREHHHGG